MHLLELALSEGEERLCLFLHRSDASQRVFREPRCRRKPYRVYDVAAALKVAADPPNRLPPRLEVAEGAGRADELAVEREGVGAIDELQTTWSVSRSLRGC